MVLPIKCEIVQETPLDMAIAIELLGWRWLAYAGRPVSSHPDYGKRTDMMVRRFFPPDKELHESWLETIKTYVPATMEEPLAYCYCSSAGYHSPPCASQDRNATALVEEHIYKRKLWDAYQETLSRLTRKTHPYFLANAKPKDKCLAALVASGSKYVTVVEG